MSDIVKKNVGLAITNDYGEDAGMGFENTTSDDMSLPYLNVLQATSPQVAGENPIEGARAGLLFNSVTKEVYPKTGIIFQPVEQDHVYNEWRPRTQGGGKVGTHLPTSQVVLDAIKEQRTNRPKEYGKYKSGQTGNDLVETYSVLGLVHRTEDLTEQSQLAPEPILVTFVSTKIKPWKDTLYRLFTLEGGKVPMFASRLRLSTVFEKRPTGDSYNYKIEGLLGNDLKASLIPPTLDGNKHPLLVAGRSLRDAFKAGALKIVPEEGNHAAVTEETPF